MKKIFLFAVMLLATTAMYAVDIANEIPTGWTYISNNPDQYPDPSFYKDGGIKMNFPGIGIQSPEFDAAAEATINFSVKLNKNQKNNDGNDAKAFTAYGLDANGDVVAEEGLDVAAAGDFSITVAGEGIVAVKLIMTAYPTDGESFYNADLLAVEIDGEGGGQGGQGGNEDAEFNYVELTIYDVEDNSAMGIANWALDIYALDDPEAEQPNTLKYITLDFYNTSATSIAGTYTEEDLSQYAGTAEADDEELVGITSANFSIEYVSTDEDGYINYIINADVTDANGRNYKIVDMAVSLYPSEGTWNETTEQYDFTSYDLMDEESGATGVENIENATGLDLNAPMFNVLGQKVDAQFRGVVIQNGKKYILR